MNNLVVQLLKRYIEMYYIVILVIKTKILNLKIVGKYTASMLEWAKVGIKLNKSVTYAFLEIVTVATAPFCFLTFVAVINPHSFLNSI